MTSFKMAEEISTNFAAIWVLNSLSMFVESMQTVFFWKDTRSLQEWACFVANSVNCAVVSVFMSVWTNKLLRIYLNSAVAKCEKMFAFLFYDFQIGKRNKTGGGLLLSKST